LGAPSARGRDRALYVIEVAVVIATARGAHTRVRATVLAVNRADNAGILTLPCDASVGGAGVRVSGRTICVNRASWRRYAAGRFVVGLWTAQLTRPAGCGIGHVLASAAGAGVVGAAEVIRAFGG
jgi:hypothetical protein